MKTMRCLFHAIYKILDIQLTAHTHKWILLTVHTHKRHPFPIYDRKIWYLSHTIHKISCHTIEK